MTTVSAQVRGLFVQEWLACTLRTASQASRCLRDERDPFRNPVGHTLRAALGDLADELFGDFDRARVTASLDAALRIHAVQDVTPSEAVEFVLLARGAARAVAVRVGDPGFAPGSLEAFDARVEAMLLMAFDIYESCREQLRTIAVRDARRRLWTIERMLGNAPEEDPPPKLPGSDHGGGKP